MCWLEVNHRHLAGRNGIIGVCFRGGRLGDIQPVVSRAATSSRSKRVRSTVLTTCRVFRSLVGYSSLLPTREVGCVIAASWREDSDRQLPGSSEVVGLAQVAPLPKVPCACTPGAGSQVAKSRPLRHQATWTDLVILAPQCAGSGGMAFFVFHVKFNYTNPVRGNQEPPRTPGRGHPPDTTGNPCPTESRRYRPRTGPKAGPEPGPRPDRIPRAPDPNPTTPSEGKPSTISPVSRTDVPRYVGTWHVGI